MMMIIIIIIKLENDKHQHTVQTRQLECAAIQHSFIKTAV